LSMLQPVKSGMPKYSWWLQSHRRFSVHKCALKHNISDLLQPIYLWYCEIYAEYCKKTKQFNNISIRVILTHRQAILIMRHTLKGLIAVLLALTMKFLPDYWAQCRQNKLPAIYKGFKPARAYVTGYIKRTPAPRNGSSQS
jgi:hypothetical protein